MLILIFGEAGSGKTFFTDHKLFPYVGKRELEVIRDALPAQLKSADIAAKFQGDGVLVIEAHTDKDVPQELRDKADYIVFTTITALGDYFNRLSNDVGDIRQKRAYSAVKAVCGVQFTPVVYDPNGKRFIVHYD